MKILCALGYNKNMIFPLRDEIFSLSIFLFILFIYLTLFILYLFIYFLNDIKLPMAQYLGGVNGTINL